MKKQVTMTLSGKLRVSPFVYEGDDDKGMCLNGVIFLDDVRLSELLDSLDEETVEITVRTEGY